MLLSLILAILAVAIAAAVVAVAAPQGLLSALRGASAPIGAFLVNGSSVLPSHRHLNRATRRVIAANWRRVARRAARRLRTAAWAEELNRRAAADRGKSAPNQATVVPVATAEQVAYAAARSHVARIAARERNASRRRDAAATRSSERASARKRAYQSRRAEMRANAKALKVAYLGRSKWVTQVAVTRASKEAQVARAERRAAAQRVSEARAELLERVAAWAFVPSILEVTGLETGRSQAGVRSGSCLPIGVGHLINTQTESVVWETRTAKKAAWKRQWGRFHAALRRGRGLIEARQRLAAAASLLETSNSGYVTTAAAGIAIPVASRVAVEALDRAYDRRVYRQAEAARLERRLGLALLPAAARSGMEVL